MAYKNFSNYNFKVFQLIDDLDAGKMFIDATLQEIKTLFNDGVLVFLFYNDEGGNFAVYMVSSLELAENSFTLVAVTAFDNFVTSITCNELDDEGRPYKELD